MVILFNSNIKKPKDRNIYLKDIIDHNIIDYNAINLKQQLINSETIIFKALNGKDIIVESPPELPFTFYEARTELGKQIRREARKAGLKDTTPRGKEHKKYIPLFSGKANCLVTVNSPLNYIIDCEYNYRKFTPTECEKLQNLEMFYTRGVSDQKRYHQCGNGWTVNIIVEIFKQMNL